jgi:hypothetical protein
VQVPQAPGAGVVVGPQVVEVEVVLELLDVLLKQPVWTTWPMKPMKFGETQIQEPPRQPLSSSCQNLPVHFHRQFVPQNVVVVVVDVLLVEVVLVELVVVVALQGVWAVSQPLPPL